MIVLGIKIYIGTRSRWYSVSCGYHGITNPYTRFRGVNCDSWHIPSVHLNCRSRIVRHSTFIFPIRNASLGGSVVFFPVFCGGLWPNPMRKTPTFDGWSSFLSFPPFNVQLGYSLFPIFFISLCNQHPTKPETVPNGSCLWAWYPLIHSARLVFIRMNGDWMVIQSTEIGGSEVWM